MAAVTTCRVCGLRPKTQKSFKSREYTHNIVNKCSIPCLYKQNWLKFLFFQFVVKAAAFKQQTSKFYPQIPSTEASHHIYTCSLWPIEFVALEFPDTIVIFAVLKQWLLQQSETEAV